MSAINTFAFQNVIVFPRTGCACVRLPAEDFVPTASLSRVTPRWKVETDKDGTRRLVQQWFRNETKIQEEQ